MEGEPSLTSSGSADRSSLGQNERARRSWLMSWLPGDGEAAPACGLSGLPSPPAACCAPATSHAMSEGCQESAAARELQGMAPSLLRCLGLGALLVRSGAAATNERAKSTPSPRRGHALRLPSPPVRSWPSSARPWHAWPGAGPAAGAGGGQVTRSWTGGGNPMVFVADLRAGRHPTRAQPLPSPSPAMPASLCGPGGAVAARRSMGRRFVQGWRG